MQHRIGPHLIRAVLLITSFLFIESGQAQDFPEGEGRDIILFACTACHGLDNITAPHKPLTAEEWEVYLYDMIAKGANVTVEEIEPAKHYLIDNFAADKN